MVAVQPHVFRGIHRILNGREFLSELITIVCSIHVLSCLQSGTAIQSRRLSEYSCYAPMVLRGPRTHIWLLKNLSGKPNSVCKIAIVDAVFGQVGCIWHFQK